MENKYDFLNSCSFSELIGFLSKSDMVYIIEAAVQKEHLVEYVLDNIDFDEPSEELNLWERNK